MEKLVVSSSPHIHSKVTTQSIMRDVLIALTPAAIASVVLFGLKALFIIIACVGSSVLAEFLFNLICKKTQTVTDLSATVTGLLLALSIPAKAEIWHCVIGAVFAIVVVKCLFGGIGHNFANPAITARIFLFIAFAASIGGGSATVFSSTDLVASATPLEIMKYGNDASLPSLFDMLVGNRSGAIGETCIIALA
jgi:electron transport complex protein RnfD